MHRAGSRKGPNKASKRVAPPCTSHKHDAAANSGPAPRGACHPPAAGTCQAILRGIVTAEDSPSWEELSFLLSTSSTLSHCPLRFPQPPFRTHQAKWHVLYLITRRGSRECRVPSLLSVLIVSAPLIPVPHLPSPPPLVFMLHAHLIFPRLFPDLSTLRETRHLLKSQHSPS